VFKLTQKDTPSLLRGGNGTAPLMSCNTMNLGKLIKRFQPQPSHPTPPIRAFAASMWAVFNLGNPNERYQRFLQQGRPRLKAIVESLLIHDEIVIPTHDFLSLAILVGVLGEKNVIELLEERCLRFLRVNGFLAYVGNGGGIRSSNFIPEPGKPPAPSCAPLEEAIAWALGGLNVKISDARLVERVVRATEEVDLEPLGQAIRHETYMDILKSPELRATFGLRNTDMDHLQGVEPNGVRIYGGMDTEWEPDEINVVLSLAMTNLEFRLAQHAGCTDSSTASPVGHVIKAKAQRLAASSGPFERFAQLREITEIPDLGEGVLEKAIPLEKLVKLRRSRRARQFRRWFQKRCQGDTASIGREYAKLVGEIPVVGSLPARVIRLLITTGIGFTHPAAGVVAGTVDSFVLQEAFRGDSPKFFIEDLRQVRPATPSGPSHA